MTNTITQHSPYYTAVPSARDTVRQQLIGWRAWIKQAVLVAHQRRALATMDAEQLADIGLTREQAAREAARPFWDLPRT